MNKIRRALSPVLPTIVAALALAACPVATGQVPPDAPESPAPPIAPNSTGLKISLAAGYQHEFRTDLDSTGSYSANRLGAELKFEYPIDRNFQISSSLRTLFDDYRFSAALNLDPLAGSPWDDVTTIAWDFRVRWWMTSDLALVFGPFINWSRESGASWGDAVTGGAFAGVLVRSSDRLSWGGGLGISTWLEDEALVYPILFLDWTISENASLTSVAGPIGLAFTGLEFVWRFQGGFEVGAGFRYELRRFRLDDSGFAPDGVGETQGLPFWGRVSYRFTPNFSLDGYFGVVAAGKFKVDDMNGDVLRREDHQAAPTLALALRFDF